MLVNVEKYYSTKIEEMPLDLAEVEKDINWKWNYILDTYRNSII